MGSFAIDCKPWDGKVDPTGYGRLAKDGKKVYSHRAAFMEAYGPITEGHVIHHLCQNPICVEPEHLVSTSMKDHWFLFHTKARKSHCPQGHALTEENRYPYGGCKTCSRAKAKAARARARI